MGRPSPEEFQPPVTPWGHTWRVLLVLVISGTVLVSSSSSRTNDWLWLDVLLGLGCAGLVVLRRRYPVPVAVVTTVLTSVSALAAGPATLAAVSLATRRRWPQVVGMGLLTIAAATIYAEVHPSDNPEPWWLLLSLNVAFTLTVLAWGMYVGSRRELLWTLRARAERAEAEQELRASQSRLEERGRIAREMHDVLAHRISQISMRAGALGYRDDLSADELREGVVVIRDAANQALNDLRGVLGVLRDDDGSSLHAPQPTYADLGDLVDEARSGGMRVTYADEVADVPVPEATGRTLYRIVQEGITNARKHAPDAELAIDVHGSPDTGIDVVLTNPLGFGPPAAPGAGLGLVGLAERAALRGGRLEHGVRADSFELRGWIPWTA